MFKEHSLQIIAQFSVRKWIYKSDKGLIQLSY